MKTLHRLFITLITICSLSVAATEYHVSVHGNDKNSGTSNKPFRTITAGANIARAGDVITVHEGIYRERVNPINGGTNHNNRIIYQAAPNEKVIIKGSEIITNWQKQQGNVWKVVIPNSFFKDYNPYADVLIGDWFNNKGMTHHTGEVFLNGKSLFEKASLNDVMTSKPYPDARDQEASTYTWYAEVTQENTTIWANFQAFNPNKELVEINVRASCFYPKQPGINYITVRGFTMSQAATQWAAPTAEQIGLIGTHWSKGWIIENNRVSNSKSVGITLGKDRSTGHNVWLHNRAKGGATHYNEVIFKALDIGWSKEKIGSHLVRNNVVFDCGQAGIVGSLGAIFSEISNNHIYDIWTKRIFKGAEMAGIKIHAPIDMLIKNNHVHNTGRGIWLDWMTQGARVTGNLLYDNTTDDIHIEVNHGPYLVDNNIFLSELAIRDWSQGGAYAHNLVAGKIEVRHSTGRFTPYHLPHSTKVAGVSDINSGDNRFFNNIFIKAEKGEESAKEKENQSYGLHGYKIAKYPNISSGNIYLNGAKPQVDEVNFLEKSRFNPAIKIKKKGDEVYLELTLDDFTSDVFTNIVTTEILGTTFISEAMFENPDESPYVLDTDYWGKTRVNNKPSPGPFEIIKKDSAIYKVW
ncbi:MAG: right-handed parallel beta-helix repeat-containing protein [Thalassotalea sp.]